MKLLKTASQIQSGSNPQSEQNPNSPQIVSSNHKNKNSKPTFSAYFPGLVDIVLSAGRPAFLIKEEGLPKVLFQIELDGKLYLPPPINQIPWLLPRADKVIEYYNQTKEIGRELTDHNLFEELIA